MNAISLVYFQSMIDAIAAIGLSFKRPNYYAFRTKLLYDLKKEVELLVEACHNT